jgi:hypothetical protein
MRWSKWSAGREGEGVCSLKDGYVFKLVLACSFKYEPESESETVWSDGWKIWEEGELG